MDMNEHQLPRTAHRHALLRATLTWAGDEYRGGHHLSECQDALRGVLGIPYGDAIFVPSDLTETALRRAEDSFKEIAQMAVSQTLRRGPATTEMRAAVAAYATTPPGTDWCHDEVRLLRVIFDALVVWVAQMGLVAAFADLDSARWSDFTALLDDA